MTEIKVVSLKPPQVDKKEVLRYAGSRASSRELESLLEECVSEAEECLVYKACYGIFPVSGEIKSRGLKKNLRGCSKAVVFAATVGLGVDRLIMKYGRISPSKALMLQAYGAERIEALCDALCLSLENELGAELRPRFSPGYGDLPLEAQREIFRVLDCPKRIGLTLNDSLLMSPTKSVTAIVGIKDGF